MDVVLGRLVGEGPDGYDLGFGPVLGASHLDGKATPLRHGQQAIIDKVVQVVEDQAWQGPGHPILSFLRSEFLVNGGSGQVSSGQAGRILPLVMISLLLFSCFSSVRCFSLAPQLARLGTAVVKEISF